MSAGSLMKIAVSVVLVLIVAAIIADWKFGRRASSIEVPDGIREVEQRQEKGKGAAEGCQTGKPQTNVEIEWKKEKAERFTYEGEKEESEKKAEEKKRRELEKWWEKGEGKKETSPVTSD